VSAQPLAASTPRVDARSRVDSDLVRLTLAGDQAAWREIMRRYDTPLHQAIFDAALEPTINPAEVDDLMSEFWLSLVESDMRKLRAFNPSRGAALLSWLTIQLVQALREHERRRAAEPEMVPLDEVRRHADTRPPPAPRFASRATMLRVEEVAERWDLNVKTVYAMIARGELAARRCGRVMRVPRHVVESFESQASVGPGGKRPCR
jgi:excisionase family DNA binding protein